MPVAADRTLFQFWAPDRSSVDLEIAGMQALAMHPEAEGWFRLEVPCGAGTRYRYRLSPDVLVPRPETELLVEAALERLPVGPQEIVDLGTGSGAIALALAHERPRWQVTATDGSICEKASSATSRPASTHSCLIRNTPLAR